MTLVIFRGRHEKLSEYQKARKLSNCCIENFVPWLQLPHRRQYHPSNSRQLRETLGGEEVEDTMLDLLNPFTEGFQVRAAYLPQLRQLEVTFGMKLSKNYILKRNFLRLSPMRA